MLCVWTFSQASLGIGRISSHKKNYLLFQAGSLIRLLEIACMYEERAFSWAAADEESYDA